VGLAVDSQGDATFRMAYLGINATLARGVIAYGGQVEQHDKFDSWVYSRLNVNSQAFMTTQSFVWMVTMAALLSNTIQSVAIAIAFCWIVLICCSWNWMAGSLALVSVVSIVTMGAAWMVILGWSLGIIECIALIVVVGISVDYSVHIAHAYVEAEPLAKAGQELTDEDERIQRTRFALATIGISLTSGLFTSLGGALFLFFCALNVFRKFGIFLFLTLLVSFACAFLMLVPMLLVVGPTGTRGQLPPLSMLWKRNKVAPEDETTTTTSG
jgi:predicted RND superfamily exporter protein